MRYLTENRRTRTPGSVICFHSLLDQYPHPHSPKSKIKVHKITAAIASRWEGGKWTRNAHKIFRDAVPFWPWVESYLNPRRPTWLIAHNVGQFATALGLWNCIDSGRYAVDFVVDSDPPIIMSLQWHKCKLLVLDLRNWFRSPLAKIATDCGLPRADGMADGWPDDAGLEAVSYYAAVVTDAWRKLVAFIREHDLGNMRYTISSQAMAAYRHRFGPRIAREVNVIDKAGNDTTKMVNRVLPLLHRQPQIIDLERAACFGGETSCFFVGKIHARGAMDDAETQNLVLNGEKLQFGPVYHVDVNSLFPSVMQGKQYPSRLEGYGQDCDVFNLATLAAKHEVVANVELCTWYTTYPVRYQGRTVFGRGRFWTTLCADELRGAIMRGEVSRVGLHACYRQSPLFDAYVSYLYPLKVAYRDANNHCWSELTKLLLNSLYGKFGQRSHKWEETPDVTALRRWGRWTKVLTGVNNVERYRSIGGCVQREAGRGESNQSFPAIAACVVSNARERMRTLRGIVGRANIFYQGIDSLALSGGGYKRLCELQAIDPNRLGGCKLECIGDSAEFVNVRNYRIGDKWTVAGLPAASERAADGRCKFIIAPQMPVYVDDGPRAVPTTTEVTMRFDHPLMHGVVGADGWVTAPVFLSKENDDGLASAVIVGREEDIYFKIREEATGVAYPTLGREVSPVRGQPGPTIPPQI